MLTRGITKKLVSYQSLLIISLITFGLSINEFIVFAVRNAYSSANEHFYASDKDKPVPVKNETYHFAPLHANAVVAAVDSPRPASLPSLTINGILASSHPGRSIAIISSSDGQHTYKEGDQLSGVPQYRIKTINPNSVVVINNSSQSHEIEFLKDHIALSPVPQDSVKSHDNSFAKSASLADYITANPIYIKGTLKGLRLNPGKDEKLFSAWGLARGDVAVKINNFILTNDTQLQDALADLSFLRSAQLTIIRNEQSHLININLDTSANHTDESK
jgi:general secretion pathway protein C